MNREAPFLTISEVSAWLQVKPGTLYAWASQGKIPHVKIHGLIRFQAEEIQQWLTSFHPQNANLLKLKGKKSDGLNYLDTIIVRAKQEAYNSNRGKPDHGRTRKEGRHGI
jgi:excisionase family DNA binding protein